MIWTIIFLVFLVLFLFSLFINIRERKDFKKRMAESSRYRTISTINYLVDTENADRVLDFYKEDMEESEEYHRSAKELKEDYDNEKVWKYEPIEIPFKLAEKEVYAQLDDEWVKVGRLKKTADLNGELKLYLYVNEYKYVTEESVDKEKGDHYFGIECKRTIDTQNPQGK